VLPRASLVKSMRSVWMYAMTLIVLPARLQYLMILNVYTNVNLMKTVAEMFAEIVGIDRVILI
jgi:hypothetical protein